MNDALLDSQRQLEAVLDNATVAIFLMDDRQHCIYMNRAAEALTGWTLPEVLELDRPLHDIIHHTHPDGRPFPLRECEIDRAFPEHARMQGEEVFIHKDGHFYPVAFTASPIRDEAVRTIGTIIEVRDITEQKRAEERQSLLVNELNHRVKNTLAAIQSIARQTFADAPPEMRELFGSRLVALSKAHNILTDNSWNAAPISSVVRSAIEPFGSERFDVAGEELELHPKAAVSLSMGIHELCTNAVKYGALSNMDGRVALKWNVETDRDSKVLTIVWREEGGPPVAVAQREGFGFRLLKRQISLEFYGRTDLDLRPEGLVCTIVLTLPNLPVPLNLEGARDSE